MTKIIKHPLLFLVFALFVGFSSASYSQEAPQSSDIQQVENSINGIMDFPVNTSGPDLEYTHLWFKQMLGGFIFAPWNAMGGIDNGNYDVNDQTVLAKALGFTNILAIIICLVVGYYLIVGGAINTAAKGEVLGSNWDGPWLAIRTSIGFGMLIPLKGIGGMTLSFSQVAVIWLIMIGSNAATLLWNMVGDSIVSGTQITTSNLNPGFAEVGALATMVACAELSVMAESKEFESSDVGNGMRFQEKSSRRLATIYHTGNTRVELEANKGAKHPVYTDSSYWTEDKVLKANSAKQIQRIRFGPVLGDSCGTINIPIKGEHIAETGSNPEFQDRDYAWHEGDDMSLSYGGAGDDWDEVRATSYKLDARIAGTQAYAQIILDTSNKLVKLMRKMHPIDGKPFNSKNVNEALGSPDADNETYVKIFGEYYDEFEDIAEDYVKRVKKEIYEKSVGNPQFVKKIKEDMMHGGWAGAGIWFMELSTIPAIPYQSFNTIKKQLLFSDAQVCPKADDTSTCGELLMSMGAYRNIVGEAVTLASGSNPLANPQDAAQSVCDSSGECQSPSDVSDRTSIYFSQRVLGFLGSNDEEALNPFDDETSLASPFLFLSEMGQTLNEAAYIMIGGVIVINTIMDYVEGLNKASNETIVGWAAKLSGANVYKHLIFGFFFSFAKSTAVVAIAGLIAAAITAMTSGFLLAYVIPFMPITTWILMMAGYMLTVVEAIAAAPLAIVLLFTPEGSGIAGSRFERALNLVAMAILRPSFMVLGLVAAITVSFVAFSMMNTFFFKAAEHVLTGHLFDAIAIMLIYVSTSYQLCKMMVENMHQLPDRIGEWFAGGVSRQFGESRVNDSAEQSVQGAAGQFKSLPTSVMGMQSAMRETAKKEGEAEDLDQRSRKT